MASVKNTGSAAPALRSRSRSPTDGKGDLGQVAHVHLPRSPSAHPSSHPGSVAGIEEITLIKCLADDGGPGDDSTFLLQIFFFFVRNMVGTEDGRAPVSASSQFS